MPTVTYDHRIDKVLTSFAELPTCEPTRSDTEQTMTKEVMTLSSVGKYTYTFTDPAKELSYNVLIEQDDGTDLTTVEVYGATDINYNTITDGNEYFAGHIWGSEDWFGASRDAQQWALNEGTKRLDALAYNGEKSDADQLKAFPRDNEEIPAKVLEAHLDITLKMLQDFVPSEEVDNLQVQSEAYAGVRTTLDTTSASKPWVLTGIMCSDAFRKLIPYLRNSRRIRILRA